MSLYTWCMVAQKGIRVQQMLRTETLSLYTWYMIAQKGIAKYNGGCRMAQRLRWLVDVILLIAETQVSLELAPHWGSHLPFQLGHAFLTQIWLFSLWQGLWTGWQPSKSPRRLWETRTSKAGLIYRRITELSAITSQIHKLKGAKSHSTKSSSLSWQLCLTWVEILVECLASTWRFV